MIQIIDTCPEIPTLFENGTFQENRWENYINRICPNSAQLFREDANECISSGKYTFEKDFLPVINAVCQNPKLDILHENFRTVTKNLDSLVKEKFEKPLNADIILYLGLCNGAGWVTSLRGRDTILLGAEKILELDWHGTVPMYGLIYHELGHVYHSQHGLLDLENPHAGENFIWQLFTEGIAMYFEQTLKGDYHFYHQDKDGWTAWCETHFPQILADFNHDLPAMTRQNQRYFGDWCDYHGRGDAGYYLGCRFVQELGQDYRFDELINFDADQVYGLYQAFVHNILIL